MIQKDFILQIDLERSEEQRFIEKIRANGMRAVFYNMHLHFYDEENEKGNIGECFEKLTKAEYDAGRQGTKIGYIKPLRKHT